MTEADVIPARLRQLLEMFDAIDDMDQRMSMLVGYSEQLKPVPASVASPPYSEEARVPYCESEAFVWGIPAGDGTIRFHFAVGNPSGVSARALSAILEKTVSGAPAREIAAVEPDIVNRIFRQNITMGKGMGLMGIVERVRNLARATLPSKSTP